MKVPVEIGFLTDHTAEKEDLASFRKIKNGLGGMVEWGRVLAAKPDNLSSILHIPKMKREKLPCSQHLHIWPLHNRINFKN